MPMLDFWTLRGAKAIAAFLSALTLAITTSTAADELPKKSRWEEDCLGEADKLKQEVRLRLLPLDQKFVPQITRWQSVAPAATVYSSPDSWRILTGDIDGDGKTDILISDPRSPVYSFGFAASDHHFRLVHIPQAKAEIPGQLQGIRIAGLPGECARFLIAPKSPKDSYTMLSWKSLANEGGDLVGDLKRQYSNIELGVYWVDDASFSFYERESKSFPAATGWTYESGFGWRRGEVPLHRDLMTAQFLGLGEIPPDQQTRSLFAKKVNSYLRILEASPTGPDTLVSIEYNSLLPTTFAGDFNGDGITDFLIVDRETKGRGSWLIITLPETTVSMPFVGLNESLKDGKILGVGDFDGDGSDELLLALDGGLNTVSFQSKNLPTENIQIEIDGNRTVLNEHGQGVINPNGPSPVRILSEQLRVNPSSLAIPPSKRRIRSRGILFEQNREALDGRPFHFGFNPQGPFPCIGVLPTAPGQRRGDEDWVPSWGAARVCPIDHAIVSLGVGKEPYFNCCPLPADILRPRSHHWIENSTCPENSIMTGYREYSTEGGSRESKSKIQYRCSSIDETRYQLLPSRPGRFRGERTDLSSAQSISRLAPPPGLVHSLSRLDWKIWDEESCLGEPWGSVLVSNGGRRCEQKAFSRLLPRKLENLRSISQIFPFRDCLNPPDALDPTKGCEERKPADFSEFSQ